MYKVSHLQDHTRLNVHNMYVHGFIPWYVKQHTWTVLVSENQANSTSL